MPNYHFYLALSGCDRPGPNIGANIAQAVVPVLFLCYNSTLPIPYYPVLRISLIFCDELPIFMRRLLRLVKNRINRTFYFFRRIIMMRRYGGRPVSIISNNCVGGLMCQRFVLLGECGFLVHGKFIKGFNISDFSGITGKRFYQQFDFIRWLKKGA